MTPRWLSWGVSVGRRLCGGGGGGGGGGLQSGRESKGIQGGSLWLCSQRGVLVDVLAFQVRPCGRHCRSLLLRLVRLTSDLSSRGPPVVPCDPMCPSSDPCDLLQRCGDEVDLPGGRTCPQLTWLFLVAATDFYSQVSPAALPSIHR